MNGWIIFAIVVLVLFLLLQIRVGGLASYSADGPEAYVRVGLIRIRLYPPKPKTEEQLKQEAEKKAQKEAEKTAKKEAEKKAKQEAKAKKAEGGEDSSEPKAKKGGLPLPLMELISMALDAVGDLLSSIQVDCMNVRYTIPGKRDPAGAAIQYGMLCAGGGAIVPVLENTFYRVKERNIDAYVDFEGEEALIWLELSMSIRLGQVLWLGLKYGIRFLLSYRKKKQEAKKHGTEASDQ